MIKPLLPFLKKEDSPLEYVKIGPSVVYKNTLDNRYDIEVVRHVDYWAFLYLFDHAKNDKLIYAEEVWLNYGAAFGPDGDNIEQWGNSVVNFVDLVYTKEFLSL